MITNFSLRFPRNHQPLIGILDASLARWRRTTTTNRKLENKCVAYCRRFAPTRAMLTSNIIILLAMGCLGGACRGLNNTCKRPCVLVCFFFVLCCCPFCVCLVFLSCSFIKTKSQQSKHNMHLMSSFPRVNFYLYNF